MPNANAAAVQASSAVNRGPDVPSCANPIACTVIAPVAIWSAVNRPEAAPAEFGCAATASACNGAIATPVQK